MYMHMSCALYVLYTYLHDPVLVFCTATDLTTEQPSYEASDTTWQPPVIPGGGAYIVHIKVCQYMIRYTHVYTCTVHVPVSNNGHVHVQVVDGACVVDVVVVLCEPF